MTDFPTGNLTRDGVIVTVLQEAMKIGDPITFANIGLQCDQYGDRLNEPTRSAFKKTWAPLNEAEFTDAVAFIGAAVTTRDGGSTEPEAEQQPAPEISRHDAQANVRMAHDNLQRARRDLMAAQAASKAARGVLSQCVLAWQRGGLPAKSPLEAAREFIQSEQMEREARGPDRRYARSAKAYTQKLMRNGGNKRGAFSQLELQRMTPEQRAFVGAQAARMRREVPLTADMTRPKLPSER